MKQYPRKRVQYVTELAGQQVNPEQLGDELVLHYSIPSLQEIGKPTKEPASDIASNKWLLEGGEVLVSKLNVHKNCIAIADKTDELPIVASTEFVPLRPMNVNSRFLAYVFQGVETIELLTSFSESATRSHARVNPSDIIKLKIPQPPLETQRRIADYLDRETARIDALIAEKKKMLALLEEKRTALISRAVTRGLNPDVPMKPSGLDWLGDIPVHWETSKFSWVVYIAEGQVDPENPRYLNYALVAPNHIESGTGKLLLRETAEKQGAISGKYLCRRGDVIYSKIRPALRKACLAEEECLCSADMYPLRPYGMLDSEFLLYLLLSDQFSTWAVLESQRVAMPKINRETLNELRIPVPPVSEQKRIVSFLQRNLELIERQRLAILDSVALLRERRAALITAAVTGHLHLGTKAA